MPEQQVYLPGIRPTIVERVGDMTRAQLEAELDRLQGIVDRSRTAGDVVNKEIERREAEATGDCEDVHDGHEDSEHRERRNG